MNVGSTKVDPKVKAIAVMFLLLIIGAVLGIVISNASTNYVRNRINYVGGKLQKIWPLFAEIYTIGTVVICMNMVLLLALLGVYTHSFMKTRSAFMFGLVLFIGVLFVQSLLSIPIIHLSAGSIGNRFSLLGILPNLFETVALIILFYLSME